jgi:hypothetical protein
MREHKQLWMPWSTTHPLLGHQSLSLHNVQYWCCRVGPVEAQIESSEWTMADGGTRQIKWIDDNGCQMGRREWNPCLKWLVMTALTFEVTVRRGQERRWGRGRWRGHHRRRRGRRRGQGRGWRWHGVEAEGGVNDGDGDGLASREALSREAAG